MVTEGAATRVPVAPMAGEWLRQRADHRVRPAVAARAMHTPHPGRRLPCIQLNVRTVCCSRAGRHGRARWDAESPQSVGEAQREGWLGHLCEHASIGAVCRPGCASHGETDLDRTAGMHMGAIVVVVA